MGNKNLNDLNKSELISKVTEYKKEMDAAIKDHLPQEEKGYRLYIGSSESSKRLKKRINFKFAIQGLISIGILCGSLWMISQWRTDICLPGAFLFIFGLVHYSTIMKNHLVNTLGACELVIKKER